MAFTVFTDGSLADAAAMNANYYHLRQGNLLPWDTNGVALDRAELGSSSSGIWTTVYYSGAVYATSLTELDFPTAAPSFKIGATNASWSGFVASSNRVSWKVIKWRHTPGATSASFFTTAAIVNNANWTTVSEITPFQFSGIQPFEKANGVAPIGSYTLGSIVYCRTLIQDGTVWRGHGNQTLSVLTIGWPSGIVLGKNHLDTAGAWYSAGSAAIVGITIVGYKE